MIGSIPTRNIPVTVMRFLLLKLPAYRPKKAPIPVSTIQLESMIPITNSLPSNTERNSLSRIIWTTSVEKPNATAAK